MTAVRSGHVRSLVPAVAAALVFAAPVALAQTSAKAIYEKYHLLGTLAFDCAQPASKDNFYYVIRLLDDGRVQGDRMSGPTTRDFVDFIDKATERKPGEIEISGTRDGKPVSSVWRIEETRILNLQRTADGKTVTGGDRWIYKCYAQ